MVVMRAKEGSIAVMGAKGARELKTKSKDAYLPAR